jgi:hypothetical protein
MAPLLDQAIADEKVANGFVQNTFYREIAFQVDP